MKKLVVGAFIILMASSCGNSKSKSEQQPVTQDPYSLTLNGIKYSDAEKMVKDFMAAPGKYDDKNVTNIWFSSSDFQKMYSFLPTNYTGVRIYFAKKATGNDIIIVGTFKGTDGYNDDYFTPAASNPSPVGITEDIRHNNADGGALLYSKPPCPKDDGCNVDPHYISCEKAYLMVTNYGVDNIVSTSEWFPKDLIDGLNDVLKNPKLDGIRIYYARQLHSKPYNNQDLYSHCFVFVTTMPDSNGTIHIDHPECISLRKMFDAKDNGEECPTNCNGPTWKPSKYF